MKTDLYLLLLLEKRIQELFQLYQAKRIKRDSLILREEELEKEIMALELALFVLAEEKLSP